MRLIILFGLFSLVVNSASAGIQARFALNLEASFHQPSSVRVADDGTVYVLDGVNSRIVIFNREGKQTGVISAPVESPFSQPMDLQLFGDQIIVSDTGNGRLVILSKSGDYIKSIALPKAENDAEPTGLTLVEKVIYWSDRANSRVCATEISSGTNLRCWGEYGSSEGDFRYPFMLTTDDENYLYSVDVLNGRVQVFNERGRSFGAISRFGVTDESLLRPNGITMYSNGIMMVSDSYTGRILLFEGRGFSELLIDVKGDTLYFDQPVGITTWKDRLYVVEMAKNRVQVFDLIESEEGHSIKQPPAYFTQPTRRDCVTCHLSWSEKYQATATSDAPVLPVGSNKMCQSCHHGAVIDSRLMLGQGEQHPDYYHQAGNDLFQSDDRREEAMPEEYPTVKDDIPYCGSCHTPHRFSEEDTGLGNSQQNLWMRDSNLESEICTKCHELHTNEERADGKRVKNHPYNIRLQPPPTPKAKHYATDEHLQHGLPESLLKAGARVTDDDQMICATCHRAHGGDGEQLLILADEKVCTECHQRQANGGEKEARKKGVHPIHFKPDRLVEIKGEKLEWIACKSCHDVHGAASKDNLLNDEDSDDSCRACHDSIYAEGADQARDKGVHPVQIDLDDPVKIQDEEVTRVTCQTCHRIHQGEEETASLIVTNDKIGALCAACHPNQHAESKKEAREKGIHPVNIELDKSVLINKREITKLDCLGCHSVHAGQEHTPSLLEDHRNGQLCEHCHESTKEISESDHNLSRSAPKSHNLLDESPDQAGLCGSCHSMHRNSTDNTMLIVGDEIPQGVESSHIARDRLCLGCHRDKGVAERSVVSDYTHPHQDIVMVTKKDSLPLLDIDEKRADIGEIGCITCHDPHDWSSSTKAATQHRNRVEGGEENLAGTVLNSFLRQKHINESFCVDCHGLETRLKFKYYHDERSRPDRASYLK